MKQIINLLFFAIPALLLCQTVVQQPDSTYAIVEEEIVQEFPDSLSVVESLRANMESMYNLIAAHYQEANRLETEAAAIKRMFRRFTGSNIRQETDYTTWQGDWNIIVDSVTITGTITETGRLRIGTRQGIVTILSSDLIQIDNLNPVFGLSSFFAFRKDSPNRDVFYAIMGENRKVVFSRRKQR